MEHTVFEKELQEWMKDVLNPYCLTECKITCCDCEGAVKIEKGYENLFETYKSTGKKVAVKNQEDRKAGLFKSKYDGNWYFGGGPCPNYDIKNKKCLIHGKYPRCALYPIIKSESPKEGYTLSSVCSLHKFNENQEPLKSLIHLCKKYGFQLFKEKNI